MAGLPPWVNEHMKSKLVVSPKNPLDVSTIISMYPRGFTEKKQMMPEWYHIPAGSYEVPSFVVVHGASSYLEMRDTQQTIEVPISSISVAESIIRDWMIGILEVQLGHAQPGVFFLPGEWKLDKLKKDEDATKIFERVNQMQRNWFLALVNLADSFWAKSNGNPNAISDLFRVAAEVIQIKGKPWMQNFQAVRMQNCPACGHMIMPGFPVCSNCKVVVDREVFDKLGLSFSESPKPVPVPVAK